MTSSITARPFGLVVTLIFSAVALTAAGCGGAQPGATKSPSTTFAAAATTPPPDQEDLTGIWSGHQGGAYHGTLTITWQQSHWVQESLGVFHSDLDGSIKLSAPVGTRSIHGTWRGVCSNPPCNSGESVKFETVSGGARIVYTGKLKHSAQGGPAMSGSYQTAQGRGSWSASRLGAP